ncbi:MAG: YD repeat-containing protein, partial [uncultured bacterium]
FVYCYEYDVRNRLTKKIFPDNSFIQYEHNVQSTSKVSNIENDPPKRIIDNLGNQTNFTYNNLFAINKITDTLGNIITYDYDELDRYNSIKNKLGAIYKITYNKLHLVTSIENPALNKAISTYDVKGNLLSKKDYNGQQTTYVYDSQDRIKTITNALNYSTTLNYNKNGEVVSITDPKGNSIYYEYNNRGWVSSIKDMQGNETLYFYDNAGNVVRKVKPDNSETLHEYYNNNLLKKIEFSGTTNNIFFEYDGNSNLTKLTDWTGEYKYSYDNRNRLIEIIEPSGLKIQYAYDANNRRTFLKLFNDGIVENYRLNYSYDSLNRVTQIADNLNSNVKFTYDIGSRKLSQEYSNGIKTSFAYNNLDFLTQIKSLNSSQSCLFQLDYTQDKNGNILSESELNGLTKTYSYDNIYQLLGVNYSNGASTSFTYDVAGNRLNKTENGAVSSYSYNNLNQLTQLIENGIQTNYYYDLNGNLTQSSNANETINYGYNFLNKVSSISKTGLENVTLNMAYNGLDKRISKTYSTGESYNYCYDGLNVLSETSTQYAGNKAYYMTGAIDEIYARTINGQKEFYINDKLNSLRKVTDINQNILKSFDYKPFGELLSGTSGNNHYLYIGREKDFDSIYFYRNRSYNSANGVFQQADPIGIAGGLNLYAYVNNNPINFIDPLGFCAIPEVSPDNPPDFRNDLGDVTGGGGFPPLGGGGFGGMPVMVGEVLTGGITGITSPAMPGQVYNGSKTGEGGKGSQENNKYKPKRKQIFTVFKNRKEAKDAASKNGLWNIKPEKHGNGISHFHDINHANKNKPNIHYGFND